MSSPSPHESGPPRQSLFESTTSSYSFLRDPSPEQQRDVSFESASLEDTQQLREKYKALDTDVLEQYGLTGGREPQGGGTGGTTTREEEEDPIDPYTLFASSLLKFQKQKVALQDGTLQTQEKGANGEGGIDPDLDGLATHPLDGQDGLISIWEGVCEKQLSYLSHLRSTLQSYSDFSFDMDTDGPSRRRSLRHRKPLSSSTNKRKRSKIGGGGMFSEEAEEVTEEELENWQLEMNTWRLVKGVYSERLSPSSSTQRSSKNTDSSSPPNPFISPALVIKNTIESSPSLRELSFLRDWIHSLPYEIHPVEVRKGYWNYTKNKVKQVIRLGGAGAKGWPKGLVKSLEPDAITATGGGGAGGGSWLDGLMEEEEILSGGDRRKLEPEDESYERVLLRTLFDYVRTGSLDLAIDLCRQSDQGWRAASLGGGRVYWDGGVVRSSRLPSTSAHTNENEDQEDGSMMDFEPTRWTVGQNENEGDDSRDLGDDASHGNLRRGLWKRMCRGVAGNISLDPFERALYGSISGDLSSVLPVCQTWEDHLWAHVNSLFEDRIEHILRENPIGNYWNRWDEEDEEIGLMLDGGEGTGKRMRDEDVRMGRKSNLKGKGKSTSFSTAPPNPTFSDASLVNGESIPQALNRIFHSLLSSSKPSLGAAASNPFRIAQMWIVIGKVNDLFEEFVVRLRKEEEGAEGSGLDPERLSHLLRFFSHLILFLRLVDQPVPVNASNAILRAYVKSLEANAKDDRLIAFYASNLEAEDATESYAQFLKSFENDVDSEERKEALLRTREHNLDLAKVALRTTEIVLEEMHAFLQNPESNWRGHILEPKSPDLSYEQVKLFRGLEWLTFDASTFGEALERSNDLARFFLLSGSTEILRSMLSRNPPALVQYATDLLESDSTDPLLLSQVHEFLDYECLSDGLQWFERWREVWKRKARDGERGGRGERKRWVGEVEVIVEQFHETVTTDILWKDWLLVRAEGATERIDDHRLTEMQRIRQLYIPEIVLNLHDVLYESRDLVESSLPRALDLANTLADSTYKLYPEFVTQSSNRMPEYLTRFRQASLAALDPKRGGGGNTNPFRASGLSAGERVEGMQE